jgi:CheY-like chemotaxis protein
MAQVLSNLLNNSAKYTQDGGQIRIAVGLEDGEVVFRVRDNGIGIPSEMLSSVFDLFTQVDNSLDRSQGGLGLGLTLVRSLVEMHGGSVKATSTGLGKGSEFIVRLPVCRPGETAAVDPEPAAAEPTRILSRTPGTESEAHGRRVLVVDDNFTWAESLSLLLRLEGHETQVVHDGPAAIHALSRSRYEVILMDIGLPGMSGYEVARRLRQDPASNDLLLVAITGYAEDDARRKSRDAGFDHHLVKPVDPDSILALLSSLEWSNETESRQLSRKRTPAPELADRSGGAEPAVYRPIPQ